MSDLTGSFTINTAGTRNVSIRKPGEYLLDINPVAGTVTVSQRGRNFPSFSGISARAAKVVALSRSELRIDTSGGSVNVDVHIDFVDS